jgi:hypothetical protein
VNAGERMRLHFVGVEDLGEIFDFNQVVVGCHSIPLFSVVSDQLPVVSDQLPGWLPLLTTDI